VVILAGEGASAKRGVDAIDPALSDLLGCAQERTVTLLEEHYCDVGPLTDQVSFHKLAYLGVLFRAPGHLPELHTR
jgi:hypothetical protein